MSDELRIIREQIAQRMASSVTDTAGGTVPAANGGGHTSKQLLESQPDPMLSVQMQAVTDAEAAAAKREQAMAMAETARAALQAALAAKESLAEQLRAEREATAAAQAVAARAREETRDARAKEALARREVEESWQVAECIAKTFDQSMDFSALGIASPPAAQRWRQQQQQQQQQSMLEHSRMGEHQLAAPDSRIPVYSGREATGSTTNTYGALDRSRQANHSARLASPRTNNGRQGHSTAEFNAPLALTNEHFRSTLRSPGPSRPSSQHRVSSAAMARQRDRPRSDAANNRRPDTGLGLARTASGDARLQMDNEIEVLSRRMAEMQRLVVEQRGAMAKLRTSASDYRDPIAREAARLQHIDEELRDLEQTLLESGNSWQVGHAMR